MRLKIETKLHLLKAVVLATLLIVVEPSPSCTSFETPAGLHHGVSEGDSGNVMLA